MSIKSKETVIITGSNGFLGKHLVKALKRDYRVITVDVSGAVTIKGDLFSKKTWLEIEKKAGNKKAIIINLAFIFEGNQIEKKNLKMTDMLISFLHRNPNVKLIYPSTVLVYGHHRSRKVSERTTLEPSSQYAKTKYTIEKLLRSKLKGDYLILRLTNMFGKGIKEHLVIGRILKNISADMMIELKDYTSIRDFIYVEDVVLAIKHIVDFIFTGKNIKGIYNISSGKGIDIYNLARKIAESEKKRYLLPNKSSVGNIGFNERLVVSNNKIKKLLGKYNWHPRPLEKGIKGL